MIRHGYSGADSETSKTGQIGPPRFWEEP